MEALGIFPITLSHLKKYCDWEQWNKDKGKPLNHTEGKGASTHCLFRTDNIRG